jgi:DNA polymerase III subunit delta
MSPDTPRPHPVYLFYGPEDYLIEEEVRKLIDQVLHPKERDLNLQVFNGAEDRSGQIVQAAQTIPMFSRARCILVRNADELSEDDTEPIAQYLANPSPHTCLIFWARKLGPWRRLKARVEKVGKAVEFSRLKGRALVSWIHGRMVQKGKTLSEEGAEHLVQIVGDELQVLENALEQISLSVGAKTSVELRDVEAVVSEVKVNTVFDLTEAIGERNVEKALAVLIQALESKAVPFKKDEDASKLGDPVPLLLTMIARQYRLIWRAKKLAADRGVEETARVLRVSPWMVRKMLDQGKHFPDPALREGLLRCHRTDLAVKKSRGPKNLLMEKLVIDLCRPEAR